jgi:hypothetical protein
MAMWGFTPMSLAVAAFIVRKRVRQCDSSYFDRAADDHPAARDRWPKVQLMIFSRHQLPKQPDRSQRVGAFFAQARPSQT